MRTARAYAIAVVMYALCGAVAQAACTGTSVSMFGAKGDGVSDDTAAIQSAINAAAAAGGGAVVFNVARYFTTGALVVPTGVVLCGAIEGPFDLNAGTNPGMTVVGPTLLITNNSAPFLSLNGLGSGVTDLLFYYPNQAASTATAPNVYPYTIVANAPGTKVLRSLVINAYNFLDIESGRVIAQDLFIGAFNIGVNVDHAYDHVTLRNLLHQVFWDIVTGPAYPQAIDTWVLNHGIALVVNRVDSLEVHNFSLFSRFAGMQLTDSPDVKQNPRCGYGAVSDMNLDHVQYGVIASATNTSGFEFTNAWIGSFINAGQAAVILQAGGSLAPDVLINGGFESGPWALGPFPTPAAGHLTVVDVVNYNAP